MPLPTPLTGDQVYHVCPENKLDFVTTDDLQDLDQPYGQDRVLRALEFGAGIRAEGFNRTLRGR